MEEGTSSTEKRRSQFFCVHVTESVHRTENGGSSGNKRGKMKKKGIKWCHCVLPLIKPAICQIIYLKRVPFKLQTRTFNFTLHIHFSSINWFAELEVLKKLLLLPTCQEKGNAFLVSLWHHTITKEKNKLCVLIAQ